MALSVSVVVVAVAVVTAQAAIVSRNQYPNVPLSALEEYFARQGALGPGETPTSGDPVDPLNIPFSAMLGNENDAVDNGYRGPPAPPPPNAGDDTFANKRDTKTVQSAKIDVPFSAFMDALNQDFGGDPGREIRTIPNITFPYPPGFPYTSNKRQTDKGDETVNTIPEGFSQSTGNQLLGGQLDVSKLLQQWISKNGGVSGPAGNTLDFSKMLENLGQTTKDGDSEGTPVDLSNLIQAGIFVNDSSPDLSFPDLVPDLTTLLNSTGFMGVINQTAPVILDTMNVSGIAFPENLTTLLEMGQEFGNKLSDLEQRVESLETVVEDLNQSSPVIIDTMNVSSIGFPENFTTLLEMGQDFSNKLSDLEERVEGLETDVEDLNELSSNKTTSKVKECPEGWVGDCRKGALMCYRFRTDKKTWDEAAEACAQMHGSKLVSVETWEENLSLLDEIGTKHAGLDFYTGGRKILGEFVWTGIGKPFDFTAWGPFEPNTDPDSTDECVEYRIYPELLGDYWDDIPCSEKRGYICEVPLAQL